MKEFDIFPNFKFTIQAKDWNEAQEKAHEWLKSKGIDDFEIEEV